MQFCKRHWADMRMAVDDRALTHLVAAGGKKLLEKTKIELEQGETTAESFDPLMSMHWAIAGNIMDALGQNVNPSAALSVLGEVCPLCHINQLHRDSCTDPRCTLDKENGYDWMVERAADDALARARELKLVPQPS